MLGGSLGGKPVFWLVVREEKAIFLSLGHVWRKSHFLVGSSRKKPTSLRGKATFSETLQGLQWPQSQRVASKSRGLKMVPG